MSGYVDRMAQLFPDRSRWRPSTWALIGAGLLRRALARLWGRDVMLYVGGVSFFALLAGFPALAILLGLYSLMLSPQQALIQADAFAQILPPGAGALFQGELLRLAQAPIRAISTQSALALAIGVYAAHRGFKALMAGLSFIHDEDRPAGFLSFNLLAAAALLVAFALISLISGLFLAVRVMRVDLLISPHLAWFFSEWTWASVGLSLGLTLIYRFAMSTEPVAWPASVIGGVSAAFLSLGASWASAVYVRGFAHFGATYGSIAAVVVMLVWLSWNVNAVFFGGALATEIELLLTHATARPRRVSSHRR